MRPIIKKYYHQFSVEHRHFIKNLSLLFLLRVLQRVLSLAAVFVLVRVLSQDQFGEYQFVLTWVTMLSVVTFPGLSNSTMQSISRGFQGTYKRASPYVFYGSLVASAILFLMAVTYYVDDRMDLALGFGIAGLLYPTAHGVTLWKALKTGKEDFSGIFKLDAIASVAMYSLIIVFALKFQGNYLWPLCVILSVLSVQNLWIYWAVNKKSCCEEPYEPESIRYGIKTSLYLGIYTIANQLDKILIFVLLSPASLAIFVAAERIAELFRSLMQDMCAVLAPKFAKHDGYTKHLDRKINIVGAVIGSGIVGFSFLFLPWLMIIIFGKEYSDSVPYAQALLCSVAIGNTATIQFRYIASKLDQESYRDVTAIMSGTRIVSSLICVPLMGVLGAVISAFFYRIVMVVTVHVIIRRRYLKVEENDG